MRQFNLISPIWRSFYSKDLYKDVYQNWGAGIFVYLLILITLCTIPWFIHDAKEAIASFHRDAEPVLKQFPLISITNGVAHIDHPSPYYIYDSQHPKNIIAVFDTKTPHPEQYQSIPTLGIWVGATSYGYVKDSSSVKVEQKVNTPEGPKIQKKYVVNHPPEREFQVSNYSKKLTLTLSPSVILKYINDFLLIIPPIIFVFFVFGSFVYRIFQALLYALLGMLFGAFCKVDMTYTQAYRLAIIAVTPSIILNTIVNSVWPHVPNKFILLAYCLITLIYLTFGVRANRSTT